MSPPRVRRRPSLVSFDEGNGNGANTVYLGNISKEFLGLILLPIVGNAAEHATAVTVAIKDKMDLAIGVAVGSSIQVALFLIPLLVVIGWGMGDDAMSLSFDIFQVAVLFVAVVLVNYLIADGKSHWLEGMLLMCLYCIVAVCSWCKCRLLPPFVRCLLTSAQGIRHQKTPRLDKISLLADTSYYHLRYDSNIRATLSLYTCIQCILNPCTVVLCPNLLLMIITKAYMSVGTWRFLASKT